MSYFSIFSIAGFATGSLLVFDGMRPRSGHTWRSLFGLALLSTAAGALIVSAAAHGSF